MPRYIDAEALLVSIGFDVKMFGHLRPDAHRFVKAVYDAPTADVAEVRHGEWNKDYMFSSDPHDRLRYKCSECRRVEDKKEPYCNCGAMMDGIEHKKDSKEKSTHDAR